MLRILLTVLSISVSLMAYSESIYVSPAKGKGVSQNELETITELVKTTVQEEGAHSTTEDRSSSDWVFRPKAIRLGSSYIVGITKFVDGKKTFFTKLKASSFEDMDTVINRLVRAVINEEKATDNDTVRDVTENEVERPTRRKKALRQWMVGFGPAWSDGLNTSESAVQVSGGYNWGVDYQVDLRLSTSLIFTKDDDDANFSQINIGVNYYFTDAKNAPYVTADLGYGFASAHEDNNTQLLGSDDDATGFVTGLGVGFKAFRTSNVNAGLLAKYSYMFEKTEKTQENPSLFSLSLAVYF